MNTFMNHWRVEILYCVLDDRQMGGNKQTGQKLFTLNLSEMSSVCIKITGGFIFPNSDTDLSVCTQNKTGLSKNVLNKLRLNYKILYIFSSKIPVDVKIISFKKC